MRSKEAVSDTTVDRIKERATGGEGAENKKAVQRDRRAQSLAAMGLVTREGSRYFVKTATARGRQESYEVWRDESGRVRCSCPDFERLWSGDPAFRCEHILAVKHSLAANVAADAEGAEKTVQAASAKTPLGEDPLENAKTEIHEPGSHQEELEMKDEAVRGGIPTPEFRKEITQAGQTETEAEPEPKAIYPDQAKPSQSAQVVPLAFANLLRTLRQSIDPRLIKTREGWTDRQGNTHWVE
ncbi:MAG TPA: SWIM zinc finger family protein, partial [Blastocatellia bacterium]|nr:SWIM zinc finger family protein [Blastocatellia bacterium]